MSFAPHNGHWNGSPSMDLINRIERSLGFGKFSRLHRPVNTLDLINRIESSNVIGQCHDTVSGGEGSNQ